MELTAEPELLEQLPEWARVAQEAVDTAEVQDMIRRLADFNLAVCMPHSHAMQEDGSDGRSMVPLAPSQMQIERDLVNTFVAADSVDEDGLLPVAWRWIDGVAVCAATCPHE